MPGPERERGRQARRNDPSLTVPTEPAQHDSVDANIRANVDAHIAGMDVVRNHGEVVAIVFVAAAQQLLFDLVVPAGIEATLAEPHDTAPTGQATQPPFKSNT